MLSPEHKAIRIEQIRNELLTKLASAINSVIHDDWRMLIIKANDISLKASTLKKFAEEDDD